MKLSFLSILIKFLKGDSILRNVRMSVRFLLLALIPTVTVHFCHIESAWSAACCGGGFSTPALIVGDQQAQLSQSLSRNETIIDRVDTKGVWHPSKSIATLETYRLDAAWAFDLTQIGLSIPVLNKQRGSYRYSGLGDLQASFGYEYLPDWDYHPWRPKGVGFLQLIIPTGHFSDDTTLAGADNLGQGHWGLGVGTIFTRNISKWDIFTNIDLHHFLPRSTSTTNYTGEIQPSWGGHLGLGFGWNKKDFRIGSAIEWSYEDAMKLQASDSSYNSSGSVEKFATVLLSLAYIPNDEWSYSCSWADQTLIGDPLNTSLGRTLSISLQKRWLR